MKQRLNLLSKNIEWEKNIMSQLIKYIYDIELNIFINIFIKYIYDRIKSLR